MKKMKKVLMVILVVSLLILVAPLNNKVVASNTYDFASFTEADSMAFIDACDINIPEEFLEYHDLSSLTHELVMQSYHSPQTPFVFNYDLIQQYSEDIRAAVVNHLNLSNIPSVAATSNYTLQHNTVQNSDGAWVTSGGYFNPKWQNYNCYAYSINRVEYPNKYATEKQYQPGDMSGSGAFYLGATVDYVASLVEDDLESMGYSNILITSYIPAINSSQELICVRTGDIDYHFMHYDAETNSWYHKPGNTAVLKYNYTPANSLIWNCEYSYLGVEGYNSVTYDSDVKFISYEKREINVDPSATSQEIIEAGKDGMCEINIEESGYYYITVRSLFSFDCELFSEDFEVIDTVNGTFVTMMLQLDAGTYYLWFKFETHTAAYFVNVYIDEHPHSHSYNERFVWESGTSHKSHCICGDYITSAHVVPAGSFANKSTAICLICGGMATGGLMIASNPSDLPHTDNGSYILPNGIIVLAEEDMESYFNGTLIFRTGEVE